MSVLISVFLVLLFHCSGFGQPYTTTLDTFYVQTPEYASTLGVDSLHFPCAITTPNTGSNFPVLILVHGTSALDMDANSTKDYLDSVGATYRKAKTRMFYEIADHLSGNGIVVLRYDKRSYTVNCIEKPACWFADTISPYDYIKDIHHAIEFAKGIPSVDTCNIFLAGHSQGGSFVSQVGYDRSDVQGVLNLAGTAQPIDSVAIYQEEFINSNPAGANILRQQFDSLRLGQWPMTSTLYNSHFSPRFWLDWLSHTDSAVIVQQGSDKPTALLYGTADRFVPANIHYQIWQNTVTRPQVTFQLFNGIDHGFGTEYDSIMSPSVLSFMTTWIQDHAEGCSTINTEEADGFTDVLVYPNPVNHIVFLESYSDQSLPYQLFDIRGTLRLQGILEGRQSKEMAVSTLESGLYFLRIRERSIRLVKQ